MDKLAEYLARAEHHMAATRRPAVADPSGTAERRAIFEAWRDYFRWYGYTPLMFARLGGPNAGRGYTVPCADPADFDSLYVASKSAGG
ncbi:MAG TPA: hypothetical protein VGF90_06360 [Verrucomicrobiae bacterium]|jgi:hypothetical protein